MTKLTLSCASERKTNTESSENMNEEMTVSELRDELEGVPDDETVCVSRGGALGEAVDAYRNVEGVVIKAR